MARSLMGPWPSAGGSTSSSSSASTSTISGATTFTTVSNGSSFTLPFTAGRLNAEVLAGSNVVMVARLVGSNDSFTSKSICGMAYLSAGETISTRTVFWDAVFTAYRWEVLVLTGTTPSVKLSVIRKI